MHYDITSNKICAADAYWCWGCRGGCSSAAWTRTRSRAFTIEADGIGVARAAWTRKANDDIDGRACGGGGGVAWCCGDAPAPPTATRTDTVSVRIKRKTAETPEKAKTTPNTRSERSFIFVWPY